nr:MAG TPA: hypothetical protein [Caudoviricetes sp.]
MPSAPLVHRARGVIWDYRITNLGPKTLRLERCIPETKHTEIPINPTRAGIKRALACVYSYFLLIRVFI